MLNIIGRKRRMKKWLFNKLLMFVEYLVEKYDIKDEEILIRIDNLKNKNKNDLQ